MPAQTKTTTTAAMKYYDLNAFARAYVTTALWSSTDDEGEPLDRDYEPTDIALDTLARMAEDCRKFEESTAETVSAAIETGEVKCGPDFDEYERVGHDFWLTRNGHGAGFWDGDWPDPFATHLCAEAKAFGTYDLYIGDDGMIHGS